MIFKVQQATESYGEIDSGLSWGGDKSLGIRFFVMVGVNASATPFARCGAGHFCTNTPEKDQNTRAGEIPEPESVQSGAGYGTRSGGIYRPT